MKNKIHIAHSKSELKRLQAMGVDAKLKTEKEKFMSFKVLVNTIVGTSTACPSQWEAKTDDGRCVYMRYRWDSFTLSVSDFGECDPLKNLILRKDNVIGEPYCGYMTDQEMHRLLIQNDMSSDPEFIFPEPPPMELIDPEELLKTFNVIKDSNG